MILVDVYVPSVNQTYDFRIDEYSKIGTVIEELSTMVCQKEQCEIRGNQEELMLCTMDKQQMIPRDLTLWATGILTGSRLILV